MGKCVSRLRNCIDAGQKHAASLETCELLSNLASARPDKRLHGCDYMNDELTWFTIRSWT